MNDGRDSAVTLVKLTDGVSARHTLSQASALYRPFFDYYDAAVRDPALDRSGLELCRLRFAQLLGAPGLGEPVPGADVPGDAVASIASWPTDARITASQRAYLTFAEQFLLDAQGIDDEQVDEVRGVLGDQGLTALVVAFGLIEQYQRLLLLLDPALSRSEIQRS